jgi:hypothetical protein
MDFVCDGIPVDHDQATPLLVIQDGFSCLWKNRQKGDGALLKFGDKRMGAVWIVARDVEQRLSQVIKCGG